MRRAATKIDFAVGLINMAPCFPGLCSARPHGHCNDCVPSFFWVILRSITEMYLNPRAVVVIFYYYEDVFYQ